MTLKVQKHIPILEQPGARVLLFGPAGTGRGRLCEWLAERFQMTVVSPICRLSDTYLASISPLSNAYQTLSLRVSAT